MTAAKPPTPTRAAGAVAAASTRPASTPPSSNASSAAPTTTRTASSASTRCRADGPSSAPCGRRRARSPPCSPTAPASELTPAPRGGVFAGVVDGAPTDYRLEVTYGDQTYRVDDPYRWLPTLGEIDLHLIGEGRHENLWQVLGAHVRSYETPGGPVAGTSFAVWAPSARGRAGRGRLRLLVRAGLPDAQPRLVRRLGAVHPRGRRRLPLQVPDPRRRQRVARQGRPDGVRHRGAAGDRLGDLHLDLRVGRRRLARAGGPRPSWHTAPMSIYEVHLGSWRAGLSYRQLADELVDYVAATGFTHVEFLPVAEHPFGGSWGYQVSSYYAPTARFGDPDDFRHLVDRLHQAGIGVIVDWVPGHFPKDDVRAGPLRRHRALRARRSRAAASSPTGARSSSTSAAARSATSWSRTRCTGSRSSTSTGCGSMPSPRCSTSTTPARPASGCPTSTAAARTSRRWRSCRRSTRPSTSGCPAS